MSNKPIVTTQRYDTNYAKNPKKFRGRLGFVNNATAAEVGNVIEEIVETVETVEATAEDTVVETVADIETTTETDFSSDDGLNILNEEFEPAVVIETAEINEGDDDGDFSTISLDNTKKELIAHAETLGIEVKDWWGKKKILESINSI